MIANELQFVRDSRTRFAKSLAHHLQIASTTTENLSAQLRAFSPRQLSSVGTRSCSAKIIASSERQPTFPPGEDLFVRLADGQIPVVVSDRSR